MTHYERLMGGTKEDLVKELVEVAKWARNLPSKDWTNIILSTDGLEGFVRETLDNEVGNHVVYHRI